jgi:hypothetical protein
MSKAARDLAIEWCSTTLLTRLDDKIKDGIILVMQRLHVEDLAGHFLQNGSWEHLSLPAVADSEAVIPIGAGRFYSRKAGELLHPEREPQQVLNSLKISMGSANFSAQYQQSPIPKGGHLINWDWFRKFDLNDAIAIDDVIVSCDTAMKATELSDYSVGTVWRIRGRPIIYWI